MIAVGCSLVGELENDSLSPCNIGTCTMDDFKSVILRLSMITREKLMGDSTFFHYRYSLLFKKIKINICLQFYICCSGRFLEMGMDESSSENYV